MRIQEKKLVEGSSQEDVCSWMEGIKTNDITPIEDVISELETIIETTKGNKQRQKEKPLKSEQYQEQLKYDKEKLELQLFYMGKNGRRTSEENKRKRITET